MQFHIPQYIDIEDKIFGPLTIKQAIFVAGGIGGAYVFYKLIPWFFLSAPLIVGIGILTWALAFYPVRNLGKPFIEILEAGFKYSIKNKLYLWKKKVERPKDKTEEAFVSAQLPAPTPAIPKGRLSGASFDIDVKGPERADDSDRERKGGFTKAASAEAGTLSSESFTIAQKAPQVSTFKAPEKPSYSPKIEKAFRSAGMSSSQARTLTKAIGGMGKR
ncbi:MAG: PrgI family protein [Candidatus Yonathbacteria bacterium]|nr:PrgI family protein [Candidatus Yonathbacteria bacterium]